MIYNPAINDSRDMKRIIEIIEILQPEIESHPTMGHHGFTMLIVDLIFDALYEYMRM